MRALLFGAGHSANFGGLLRVQLSDFGADRIAEVEQV